MRTPSGFGTFMMGLPEGESNILFKFPSNQRLLLRSAIDHFMCQSGLERSRSMTLCLYRAFV